MTSEDKKRQAINRIAQKLSRQTNITHKEARDVVIKHITRSENKRS